MVKQHNASVNPLLTAERSGSKAIHADGEFFAGKLTLKMSKARQGQQGDMLGIRCQSVEVIPEVGSSFQAFKYVAKSYTKWR